MSWQVADIARDDPVPHLRGADAVVHLAWLIQPTRDPERLWEANVRGSREWSAVAEAEVPVLIHLVDRCVLSGAIEAGTGGEDRPTNGIGSSAYVPGKAYGKAYIERCLGVFVLEHPSVRAARDRNRTPLGRGLGGVNSRRS